MKRYNAEPLLVASVSRSGRIADIHYAPFSQLFLDTHTHNVLLSSPAAMQRCHTVYHHDEIVSLSHIGPCNADQAKDRETLQRRISETAS